MIDRIITRHISDVEELSGRRNAGFRDSVVAIPEGAIVNRREEDDDDDDKDGDGDDDDDDDDGDDDDSDGDDKDGDDDDTKSQLAKLQEQVQGLTRKLAKSERDKRKAERQAREAKNKKAHDEGRYKDLYDESEKRVKVLEGKVKELTLGRAIVDEATKQRFRDPSLVVKLVEVDEAVDEDGNVDTTLVEDAVTSLAKTKKWMLQDPPRQNAGDVTGDEESKRTRSRNGGSRRDGDDKSTDEEPTPGLGRLRQAYEKAGTSGGRDRE